MNQHDLNVCRNRDEQERRPQSSTHEGDRAAERHDNANVLDIDERADEAEERKNNQPREDEQRCSDRSRRDQYEIRRE